jgi:hypothetical protein
MQNTLPENSLQVIAYTERKEPDSPKEMKQPMSHLNLCPTSTHIKATWTFEVPLATQILPLIKPYQALIPPNPCKFHSTYPVINLETKISPTTTTNY